MSSRFQEHIRRFQEHIRRFQEVLSTSGNMAEAESIENSLSYEDVKELDEMVKEDICKYHKFMQQKLRLHKGTQSQCSHTKDYVKHLQKLISVLQELETHVDNHVVHEPDFDIETAVQEREKRGRRRAGPAPKERDSAIGSITSKELMTPVMLSPRSRHGSGITVHASTVSCTCLLSVAVQESERSTEFQTNDDNIDGSCVNKVKDKCLTETMSAKKDNLAAKTGAVEEESSYMSVHERQQTLPKRVCQQSDSDEDRQDNNDNDYRNRDK